MRFRTLSAAVYVIDANLVDVEVDLTPVRNETDTPASVIIVGLPDLAVRESRERIRAAINNSAFFFPFHKTTINLAPADVRQDGGSYDGAIGLGMLGVNGDLGDTKQLTDILSVGELSLDGRVRPIRGALPIALRARQSEAKHILLPDENAKEAAVVSDVNVYAVTDLRNAVEMIAAIRSENPPPPIRVDPAELLIHDERYAVDFREVRGQQAAKRALEVATPGSTEVTVSADDWNTKRTWALARPSRPAPTVSISIRSIQATATSRLASSSALKTLSATNLSIDSAVMIRYSASSADPSASSNSWRCCSSPSSSLRRAKSSRSASASLTIPFLCRLITFAR